MALLRLRDATFAGGGVRVGPLTLDLDDGERMAMQAESAMKARVVALMAAAIVKASSGRVLIGDYDPCVQSVACKRIAAFVPHQPFPLEEREFTRYVAYRAALWRIEPKRARVHAELLRRRLAGMHDAFLYPLIGALIGMPKLVVLERPQRAYAAQILAACAGRTIFSTHADAASAAAFSGTTVDTRGTGRA